MEKIYGYSQKSVEKLVAFVKQNKDMKKVDIFKAFAKKYKKKSGSVRNMYYALARQGEDLFSAKKVALFDREKEDEILTHVLIENRKGKSVRNALLSLAKGDYKLYLRYQNKYRVILKNDKKRLENLTLLLKESGKIKEDFWATNEVKKRVKPFVFDRLSREVDSLIERYNLESISKDKELTKSAVTFYKKVKGLEKEINDKNGMEFFKFFAKIKN
jgi:hypothetical protein